MLRGHPVRHMCSSIDGKIDSNLIPFCTLICNCICRYAQHCALQAVEVQAETSRDASRQQTYDQMEDSDGPMLL